MDNSQLKLVLEKLPYMDGSGRRRFVTGGIILIGLLWLNWGDIGGAIRIDQIDVADFLSSPTLTFGLILLIYAIGSIVEMLGDLFLVRAASGIFWSFGYPFRIINYKSKIMNFIIRAILLVFVVPLLTIYHVVCGIVGRTSYRIQFKDELSDDGCEVFKKLPEKVSKGLIYPVGNESDFAFKYLIDRFEMESDRKWARRLITRAKDVSATTTAVLILIIAAIFSNNSVGEVVPPSISNQALSVQRLIKPLVHEARKMTLPKPDGYAFRLALTKLERYKLDISGDYLVGGRIAFHMYDHTERVLNNIQQIQIGSSKDNLTKLITGFNELIIEEKKLVDLINDHNKQKFLELLQAQNLFSLLSVFVLLVYGGFFTILKNGIVSLLEAIALEVEPSDGNIEDM